MALNARNGAKDRMTLLAFKNSREQSALLTYTLYKVMALIRIYYRHNSSSQGQLCLSLQKEGSMQYARQEG